jgi:hypothetical protein
MFREIEGVQSVSCGHMLHSTRSVVDTTFDIAIVMTFADVESMKRYIEHPQHKKAVTEVLNPVARKVVVYDFIND